MKLSTLFQEYIEEETPNGSIKITAETKSDGKRNESIGYDFEYSTKDGKEDVYGSIEILRPNTRDEDYQLEPNSVVPDQYEDELSAAEEVVRDNIDKIFKLTNNQTLTLKV